MINKYIKYLEYEKKYSINTIESYLNDIEEFNKYLEENKINYRKINKEEIRLYLKYLDELKYKNSSISRILSCLRGYYEFLYISKVIDNNPFKSIHNPKKEKKLPNFLNYNEFMDLISDDILEDNEYGIRNKLILELLFATGLRVSELCNIKLKDIDNKNKNIRVLGKGSKERIVYFGEYAKDALDDYLNYSRNILLKNNKSEYLLINNKSKKLERRGVEDIIERIVNKSSIKHNVTPHTLRHTFATEMLNNGADIRSVQELLGHESLSTTGIYTHVTNEVLRSEYLKTFPRK